MRPLIRPMCARPMSSSSSVSNNKYTSTTTDDARNKNKRGGSSSSSFDVFRRGQQFLAGGGNYREELNLGGDDDVVHGCHHRSPVPPSSSSSSSLSYALHGNNRQPTTMATYTTASTATTTASPVRQSAFHVLHRVCAGYLARKNIHRSWKFYAKTHTKKSTSSTRSSSSSRTHNNNNVYNTRMTTTSSSSSSSSAAAAVTGGRQTVLDDSSRTAGVIQAPPREELSLDEMRHAWMVARWRAYTTRFQRNGNSNDRSHDRHHHGGHHQYAGGSGSVRGGYSNNNNDEQQQPAGRGGDQRTRRTLLDDDERPFQAYTRTSTDDSIALLNRTNDASSVDHATRSLIRSWGDIAVQHKRLPQLQNNISKCCGISNREAFEMIEQLSALVVSLAKNALDYTRLNYVTSRSDEADILRALKKSTINIQWDEELVWAWRHVLPLLSKPASYRADI